MSKICCKNCIWARNSFMSKNYTSISCWQHPDCDYMDHPFVTQNALKSKCCNFTSIDTKECQICKYYNASLIETEDQLFIKRKEVEPHDVCENFKLDEVFEERVKIYNKNKKKKGEE